MSTDNKALVRHFYDEIINRANLEMADEFIADGFVDHNPVAPGLPGGREGVRQTFAMFHSGLPDMHVTVEDQIAEGGTVVSRLRFRGTHKGEFIGIQPTGKKLNISVIDVITLKDGKAIERWGQADLLGVMQQLGVVPLPEMA
jgi:steroid delta-isomerase-like uncharacterized protein